MHKLSLMKRHALPALKSKGLVAISAHTEAPEHAFELAWKMGWGEAECFSAEALASIYFTYGKKAYDELLRTHSPGIFQDICTDSHHRRPGRAGECRFPRKVCLCSCHGCQRCNERDIRRGDCGCACHGSSCERCEAWHENRRRERWTRKLSHIRKHRECEEEYEEEDEAEPEQAQEQRQQRGRYESHKEPEIIPFPQEDPIVLHEYYAPEDSRPDPAKKLARVVSRIGKAAEKSYSVSIVPTIDGMNLQGHAKPEGKIEITAKIVETFSDDELAFIVGHEFSHLAHQDHERTSEIGNQKKEEIAEILHTTDALMKQDGKGFIKRTLVLATITALSTANAMRELYAANRGFETEADVEAIQLMREAGYDTEAAVRAYTKLHHGSIPRVGFIGTMKNAMKGSHPLPEDRVKILSEEARKKK